MELRRAAIIGAGPRAAEHAGAYGRVKRGRLVAACARTLGHAEGFAERFHLEQAFDDAERMLASVRPDLLHVVTQPGERVELLTLAVEHRVPVVIVEKPIAIEGEDWRRIGELAAAADTRIVVNTQLHFHPRMVALRDDVQSGRIGELRLLDVSAGSTMSDQGVHLVELAHAFTGFAEPTAVFAQVSGAAELDTDQPSPDRVFAAIRFADGTLAHLMTGDTAPVVAPSEPFYLQKRIAAYGSEGFAHWTMFGWERFTGPDGYASGTHDYAQEDEAGQAALTDAAFALLSDPAASHPTRIERSLAEFNVVLGAYQSALRRAPVALPCDPPADLIGSLRRALSADGG